MKHLTTIGLILMFVLGSQVLQASPDRYVQSSRRGFRNVAPVQIRTSNLDRRLVREIEKNRFKIEDLRHENRRLMQRMRYESPRKAHRFIRAIERNERKIERLKRQNRHLINKLRRNR